MLLFLNNLKKLDECYIFSILKCYIFSKKCNIFINTNFYCTILKGFIGLFKILKHIILVKNVTCIYILISFLNLLNLKMNSFFL